VSAEWSSVKLYEYVKTELNEKAPKLVLSALEGTYLLFLDLRQYIDPENTKEFRINVVWQLILGSGSEIIIKDLSE